jgi:hypothetical protein
MQFIKVYENALSDVLIDDLIEWADKDTEKDGLESPTYSEGSNQSPELGVLGREGDQKFLKYSNIHLLGLVHNELSQYLNDYSNKFPGTKDTFSSEVKLQKTGIGGGYSVWQGEQGPDLTASRALAWTVYLNDVEKGGETEFLYQGFRLKATRGTLVIWPASFTHTHRGNPPYSNNKYIITGWTNFRTED